MGGRNKSYSKDLHQHAYDRLTGCRLLERAKRRRLLFGRYEALIKLKDWEKMGIVPPEMLGW